MYGVHKLNWSTPHLSMQAKKTDKSIKQTRVRRIVFTLNNWTDEEYESLKTFAGGTTWFVMGKETGENGTPHLQGACILGSQWSFSKLKTLTGFRRAHIEAMYGKPESSLVYCTKEDSNAFVHGTLPSPGKRNDIHDVAKRVVEGATLRELAMDVEQGAVAVVKFHRGLTVLRSLTRGPRTTVPKVFWVFGPTGTGKTRCVFKAARRLVERRDDDIWVSSGGLKWFDGYDGQPVAILDDFRSKHVPNFAFLLRLLDRYPINVEFKGGFVQWKPEYIFITCPTDPDDCFATRKMHKPEDIAQLHRRITQVFRFASPMGKLGRKIFVQNIETLVHGGSLRGQTFNNDAFEDQPEEKVEEPVIIDLTE